MSVQAMIEFRNVSKRYGEHLAVNDLSFKTEPGETVVLIGPSGCGKTTSLRMINRLIEPSNGQILFRGRDVRTYSPPELRRQIGYVIQSVGLFPHLTVAGNIAVVPTLLGWPRDRIEARVQELLTLIGLEPARYRDLWPRELSGGQAQRVGVARALAADPPALLMDEPFGAVDPLTRARLQQEFIRLQKQLHKTVIIVTHDLDEAILLGDRIAVMRAGIVEQFASPKHILEQPANDFVREFIGKERGLKWLGLHTVGELMHPVRPIRLEDTLELAHTLFENPERMHILEPSLFVVDEYEVFRGRLKQTQIRQSGTNLLVHDLYTPCPPEEAINASVPAREALAKLISDGCALLPVVNDAHHLVGVLELEHLVQHTAAGQA